MAKLVGAIYTPGANTAQYSLTPPSKPKAHVQIKQKAFSPRPVSSVTNELPVTVVSQVAGSFGLCKVAITGMKDGCMAIV